MKARWTSEQHAKLSPDLIAVERSLANMHLSLSRDFGTSSKASRLAHRALLAISALKCQLDHEYHKVTDDQAFKRLGHVYYKEPIDAPASQ